MIGPVEIAIGRSMAVPPGQIVKTGYVDVFKVRHACRDRIAAGDVAQALEKVLQLGEVSAWPCPRGYWEGETFVVVDGRHEHLASIMSGRATMLVAWVE